MEISVRTLQLRAEKRSPAEVAAVYEYLGQMCERHLPAFFILGYMDFGLFEQTTGLFYAP
jgi:thiamine monophosphate synthase